MSEANLWTQLREKMLPHWKADRIETMTMDGFPDVVYCIDELGVIELKFVRNWPARKDTIVRIPHYTPAQRNYLRKVGKRGGQAFLFLRVADTYMLFDWIGAMRVGEADRQELEDIAIYCEDRIQPERLAALLRRQA